MVSSSPWQFVKRGVPQGSIIGPLLFLIYVNELPSVVSHKTALFADDTSIVIRAPMVGLEQEVTQTLGSMEKWFKASSLQMNVDKTKILQFSFRLVQPLNLQYGNITLTSLQQTTFLGLSLDSQLDWKSHISNLSKKTASFSYALRVISREVNLNASLMAYHAFIASRIRYGIIFWGNSTDSIRVLMLQKECIRSIFGMHHTESCKPKFKQYNILTAPCIYIYEVLKFVSTNYEQHFKHYEIMHSYTTRGVEDKYLLPLHTNLSRVQNAVEIHSIKIWNKIPTSWKQMPQKSMLEKVKNLLLERTYYNSSDFFNDEII